MAISRFKTSTLAQGLPKYQDFWDQSTVYGIPTSGLVAKYETPPSSGSTWVDTVGSYNLALSGTTYSSSNGGVLTMGNGITSSFPDFNLGTDFTISIWVKPTALSGTSYSTSYPFVGINDGGNTSTFLATLGTSGNIYINGYGVPGTDVTGTGISTNNWYLITIGMNSSATASSTLNINGVTKSTSITGFDVSKTGNLSIGYVTSLNTNNFQGQIGSVYVWNRKITQAEANRVWDYSRGRFGL